MDDPRKATAMVGGIAGALVIVMVHILAFWGIDATAEFTAAVTVLVTGVIGWFAHPAREDAAALHELVISRLNKPPAPPTRPIVNDHT